LFLGCFIDATDLDGVTAIGHAINKEHFSIATLLIKSGCNVHVVDNEGNTLLHFLALHHNKALFERLLELGLQVDAKNSNGMDLYKINV
jgi:ankyrin repeat protein